MDTDDTSTHTVQFQKKTNRMNNLSYFCHIDLRAQDICSDITSSKCQVVGIGIQIVVGRCPMARDTTRR